MTHASSRHIDIAEDTSSPTPAQPVSSSSDSAAAVKDFTNAWLDSSQYWHDAEPGGLAYAPYAYSFDDSSSSFLPNVDTAEGPRLQGSSSATVPRSEHGFDYDAALQDVRLRQEEQEKLLQLGRDSELHRPTQSGMIPFPSFDAAGYRDLDLREQHRERVRSMGASSQRGARKESGRRDSGPREGLRATKDTENLDEMKKSALEHYRAIRYRLQAGLRLEDVDDEEDPKWLSQVLARMKSAADSSEVESTRGGRRAKKVAA